MASCSVCRLVISSDTVLVVGELSLHEDCLSCSVCGEGMEGSCYTKFGQLYCRQDYYKMFGPRCSCCQNSFGLEEEVRSLGDKRFHLDCFSCEECGVTLETGMKFGAGHRGELLCQEHFEIMKSEVEEEEKSETSFTFEMETQEDEDTNTVFPESPEKSDKENDESDKEDEKKEGKDGKRRGPRTTIKAKQLEALRTVFNQTPKPTRLVREQLAKDTGLPMRVIQVWFQNKRSKEKRMHQLRFMAGGPFGSRGPLHPMHFAPPNAIAYNFGPPGAFTPNFAPEFGCFPPMQENTFPSPPHLHGDYPHPCFPSPPISDCSPPPPTYTPDHGLHHYELAEGPCSTSF